MGEDGRVGIIIFSLWYAAIAISYALAPLLDFTSSCNKCKCGVCPALSNSNCSVHDATSTYPNEPPSPKHGLADALKAAAEASRQVAHDIEDLEDDILHGAADDIIKPPAEEPAPTALEELTADEPNFEDSADE